MAGNFFKAMGARSSRALAAGRAGIDRAMSSSIAKDVTGFINRNATNRNLLIGAAVGSGMFAASRLSNNRYVRGAGNIAGMAGLGMGGWAGGRWAMGRYGSQISGMAGKMGMGSAAARGPARRAAAGRAADSYGAFKSPRAGSAGFRAQGTAVDYVPEWGDVSAQGF